MKNFIKNFSSILLFLCLTNNVMGQQVKLENSFSSTDGNFFFISDWHDRNVYTKYGYWDKTTQMLTIYHPNHTIYKTVLLNIPSDYTLIRMHGWENLFPDSRILISYGVSYQDSQKNSCDESYLINENGTLIHRFMNASNVSFYQVGNEPIIQVSYSENLNGEYKFWYDIYSFDPNSSNISLIQNHTFNSPYPNPAGQLINIPLSSKANKVYIYNQAGQLQEIKRVNMDDDTILQLPVSAYPKGMYYYTHGSEKGEFMVK